VKLLAVYLKEMTDTLRDRRSLLSALLYALLGPLAVVFTVNVLATATRPTSLEPVAVCSGEAPDLVAHLAAAGVSFAPEAAICLHVPDDYATRIAEGATAKVRVLANLTATAATVDKLRSEIQRYSRTLASQRMLARGVATAVLVPIDLDVQNTSSVSRQADVIARLLIVFFIVTPFFVGVAAAADSTAGERERRSLEPLLSFPLKRSSLVLGKWLSVATLSAVGTAFCVIAGLTLMQRSALPELGIRLETDLATGFAVTAMLLPLTLLVSAVQVTIGLLATSFKDAQSYLTLFAFVPAVAGFVLSGERLAAASGWPMGFELNALAGPLLGSTASLPPFAVVALIELAAAALVLWLATAHLSSERILAHA
jgi:sodium transport system permease protein